MFNKRRFLALITPFVFLTIFLVLLIDGTLAATAVSSNSAPIEKQTAVANAADLPVCSGTPTRILPMGDSITFGEESSTDAGYRLPLYLDLRNSGYDIEFVGSRENGPDEPGFDNDHEGRPGWEIASFFGLGANDGPITFWLNNQSPDVLLIHIGTNDMAGADPVPQAIIDFDEFIDEIEEWEISNAISLTLVTAEIINRGCNEAISGCVTNKQNTTDFNDYIETAFNGISNRYVVDMEDGAGIVYNLEPGGDFSAEDDNPGIHPNDSGYAKMSAVWYDQLVSVLPSPCDTELLMSPAATMQTNAGQQFSYGVVASGYPAPTAYSLLSAPTGMTIDAATGVISWLPGFEQIGTHTAVVQVTNGEETVSESYEIEVVTGDMVVVQSPESEFIIGGEEITFMVNITNTGSQTLSLIPVEFPEEPSCNQANVGPLDAGFGTEIMCTLAPTASLTFPVWVTATNASDDEVSRVDSSTVDVINPAILIEKSTDTPTVLTGSDVTFTLTVTNTGDTPLTGVVVDDPAYPECDKNDIGTLDPDAVSVHMCVLTNVTADINNTATVTGTHALGTISMSDSAIVDVLAPAIAIKIDPAEQLIMSGDDADYTITVTNTGDIPLTNVTVVDNGTAVCSNTPISLNPMETDTYPCTDTSVTGDMLKQVTVTGDHQLGQISASDEALVDVFSFDIDVVKTAESEYALQGSDIEFTITVTNTSGTDMSNVDINDPLGGCFESVALTDGSSHTTTCTIQDVNTDIQNTVFVTGTLPTGTASSSDLFIVDVINPAIEISVTPVNQMIYSGDPANLEIAVENTGDVDLTAVQISGLVSADCNKTIGALASTAQQIYLCTINGLTDDSTLTASVVGTHPANGIVSDTATSIDIMIMQHQLYLPLLINH